MNETLETGSQEVYKTDSVLTDEGYPYVAYHFLVLFPNLLGQWSERSLSTTQKSLACSVFKNMIYSDMINKHADCHIACR